MQPSPVLDPSAGGARSARVGAAQLGVLDPRLEAMRRRAGVPRLVEPSRGATRFERLARSICFQQLAGKAASAIWGRTKATVGDPFTPAGVLDAGFDELRLAGLSTAKALSILDLALRVAEGQVKLDRIGRLDDEAVVAHLTQVRGIGRWTAEMFLMFTLGRLDVWPVGDLGVRYGHARIFGLLEPLAPTELATAGEAFRPYRSIVAWWCWQAMDTTT